MKIETGRLILVGAGPGDPELISMKGVKALRKANVILYDALVSKQLLGYAPKECKLIFVGKRKGKKEFSQEDINELLVFYAHRVEYVIRLKGGDPNVFGRGHEELEYAIRRGIKVEVIPGISSAIAAPSAAGIPLTKRGVNESFWVLTGTLSTGKISNDIELAARSSCTVIILMGVTNLKTIADIFIKERSPSEPVAFIQHASLPEQKILIGTVADINQLAYENVIDSPAVIVIGKVIDERKVVTTIKACTTIQEINPY